METKDLKKYAPQARTDFIEAVSAKAAVYGLLHNEIVPMQQGGDTVIIGDRAFPGVIANQRRELERQINELGYDQFIESIAYTWFNRLVAIRYMEVHGYLDHGYRVLSHPEGKATPEILEHAERLELPGLDADKVIDLKLDGSKDDELYRLILIAQCNALARLMPFMFGGTDDATELLLPDNLLHTDSLVRKLVAGLPSESLQSVEAIGWLYQFYISEKKDDVFAALKKGKKITPENIPAATQLFTPHWIVRYLVENSLGRLWMLNNPSSGLIDQMDYYIKPEEPEADFLVIHSPEEIKICDPACGSGHMLTYAFDLLYSIYEEQGYQAADITRLILENNLHGIEIDGRAGALSAFALTMKAREKYRRFLTTSKVVQPNICVLANIHEDEQLLTEHFEFQLENNIDFSRIVEEIGNTWIANGKILQYQRFLNVESVSEALIDQLVVENRLLDVVKEITDPSDLKGKLKKYIDGKSEWSNLSKGERSSYNSRVFWHLVDTGEIENYDHLFDLKRSVSRGLIETVNQFKESENFGSLIRPFLKRSPQILEVLENQKTTDALLKTNNSLLITHIHQKVITGLRQADYLSPKYHVVVANPPYMGSSSHNPKLKEMVKQDYDDAKSDLYAAFIHRNLDLLVPSGLVGMITIPNWMFLTSFEKVREYILVEKRIISLVHNGRGVWGSDFGSCSFILANSRASTDGTYLRLFKRQGEVKHNDQLIEAFFDRDSFRQYKASQQQLMLIPGSPIAYWASDAVLTAFREGEQLGEVARPKVGMNTTNNELFVRCWYEVNHEKIGFAFEDSLSAMNSDKKWFPYNKGGAFRRWFGNNDFVVDFENDGERICTYIDTHPTAKVASSGRVINRDKYFKKGISWSFVSSTSFGVRATDCGFVFDVGGSSAFPDEHHYPMVIGFLSSNVAFFILKMLNPTLNFQAGNLTALPWLESKIAAERSEISTLVDECIQICRDDWDSFESSWEFQGDPVLLVRAEVEPTCLEVTYEHTRKRWDWGRNRLASLEQRNNEIFTRCYGLQAELNSTMPSKQVTLSHNPSYRYGDDKSES